MEPRLPNSKKWTAFPPEFEKEIKKVLGQNFPEKAKAGDFSAEGRIYPSEILVRLGHLENGRIGQANAEVSVEYNAKKENVKKMIDLAIDCAGSILSSHFTDPNTDLPREWAEFDVEGKVVYAKFTTINPELETQADELLKGSDPDLLSSESNSHSLVEGENHEEEAEAMKKVFSEEDESKH